MAIIVKVGQVWTGNGLSHFTITRISEGKAYWDRAGEEAFFGRVDKDGYALWSCGPKGLGWYVVDGVNTPVDVIPSIIGIACKLCGDYCPHASPNRPDGKTFICYSCKQGWVPKGM